MGQGQSSDKEVMPRCVVSDPAQPHNFSHRSEQKVKHDCFGCGKSDVPWEIRERPLYYYCTICDLEFHKNCLEYPSKIIHPYHPQHPLVFTVINYETGIIADTNYAKVSSCRVCYKNVDIKYGQYSCNHEECFYVVHSKCATHGKIWDGEELEWEDEESEQAEDIAPYKKISGSLIEHCWHQHHFLKLEKYEGTRDSKKQCQACMRPVNPHDFYSCIECEFFIHEVCANLPRKLDHASHNHPLYMDPTDAKKTDVRKVANNFRTSVNAKVADGDIVNIFYNAFHANLLYATHAPQFQMSYTTNMMIILSLFVTEKKAWMARTGAKYVRKN
ncbi:putative protein [Arabidopsis thaliana]|uniref:Uncharacterized protein F17J16_180 n=1 Tax=Arabidopsis thaliana TaxID=3702 RepID=Q9LYS3_ARATH|nr:putative protein [Arabidopsis thaliana]